MKSYFLAPIKSGSEVSAALTAALPGAADPWLLKDANGDVIAYFSLVEADDTTGLRTVQADVSGRHYNRDADVIAILEKLRESTGGEVTNDAYAHGVNSSEVIVGESDTLIGVHAFIFTFTNGMRDLNDFIPSLSGWVLTSATAINDSGQILGMGNYQGQQRAYLLTPMPQFTLSLAQGKLAFTLSGLAIQCRYTIEASYDLHTWSELRSFTATQTQTNWLDSPNSPAQRGYYRVHF